MWMHFMRMPVFEGGTFVELAVDHGERFGSSGNRASCIAILREDFLEEVSH